VLIPQRLQQRSQLLQAVRLFFHSRAYLEVDTPVRLPLLLPEAHIRPLRADGGFLQTSPELCMKRLLARGCSRLFQVCHCFRKDECGRLHQEEFTMLEWYRAGWSYTQLMAECEDLVRFLAAWLPELAGVIGTDALAREGKTVSLASPWERLTVDEAFRSFGDISAREALEQNMFDEVLVTRVEPRLGWERPVFLYDYPVELGSLARSRADNDTVAERFELYIAGIELANGFSELTDPEEQRRRFVLEIEKAREYGNSDGQMPEKFLADLVRLGETAGIALGLDRLFMLLMGCDTVSEAMTMSPEDL